MRFIEFNAYKNNQQNASSKAKTDVSNILNQKGYLSLYRPSKFRFIRILQQVWSIIRIPKDSVVFVQYPSHTNLIYNLLHLKKGIRKIVLLHDVQSLRGLESGNKEIDNFNKFNAIISHNDIMTAWLKTNGLQKPVFNIQIFDYLLEKDIKINNNFDKFSIFFAGNLQKSHFLNKIGQLKTLKFNIYGANFPDIEKIKNQKNVTYEGSFSPEDLITNIKGGWGLVWDGESLDSCTGIIGEYLKYNNPHKVSMCIVSERPIIIWKQSAMSKYIESKGLGICVDSLWEIQDKICQMSDEKYEAMLQRVRDEKLRLINGQNLISSLTECEKILGIDNHIHQN